MCFCSMLFLLDLNHHLGPSLELKQRSLRCPRAKSSIIATTEGIDVVEVIIHLSPLPSGRHLHYLETGRGVGCHLCTRTLWAAAFRSLQKPTPRIG
jgi:hypothetical protein